MPVEPRGLGMCEADSERGRADWDGRPTCDRKSGGAADHLGGESVDEPLCLEREAERESQTGNPTVNASRKNAMRKPDAGNPHVRFDEGEGPQRSLAFDAFHPVRPSLLYWLNFF
jgi:hypothetical protein